MSKRADLIQVFLILMKMPFILQCEFPEPNECSLMQLEVRKKNYAGVLKVYTCLMSWLHTETDGYTQPVLSLAADGLEFE